MARCSFSHRDFRVGIVECALMKRTHVRRSASIIYRGYDRTWRIATPGKLPIECSNDPMLGGDPSKPNPEDLLLASLASCHMLWYLHLACNAGIVVKGYEDTPLGVGETG